MNHSQTLQSRAIRPKTVKLIGTLLRPWVEEGVVSIAEQKEIISNLKHLAEKGELSPVVVPKLVDMREAADMLSVGLSNFKKNEREGGFSFKRKMVGSSVRYRNSDILTFIMQEDNY